MAGMKYLLILIVFFYCQPQPVRAGKRPKTIGAIPLPAGYQRSDCYRSSFCAYLRQQKLKTKNNTVYLYNRRAKANQDAQYAVLTIDVGNRDLQQCADAVMRLRAEYLYGRKQYEKIQFHFTNGDLVPFSRYARGYRPTIRGSRVLWRRRKKTSYSYSTFRSYMNLIFTYAGTRSLRKELSRRNIYQLKCGDVFVQSGRPYGHAVLVVDTAVHGQKGNKIFLLAQSYMPAQEIHVLKNPDDSRLSPWYRLKKGTLNTPEWQFHSNDLRRF